MLRLASEKYRRGILDYCLKEPNINLFIIGNIENFGFYKDFQDVQIQYSKELDMNFVDVSDLLLKEQPQAVSGKLSVINKLNDSIGNLYNKKEMFFCELRDSSKLEKVNFAEIIMATSSEEAMETATASTSVNAMIGRIFTAKEYRNNGLACKMVSALAKSLIAEGKSSCLFFNNEEAGSIYYRLGFENIDKWAMLIKK